MSSPSDPELRARAEDLFAAALARQELGEALGFDELCRQHPELASELVNLKSNWDELQSFRERLLETQIQLRSEQRTPATPNAFSALPPDTSAQSLVERLRVRGPFGERYRVEEMFSHGAMGSIHRVWDEDLRRSLAMKLVRTDAVGGEAALAALSRFVEEAQITGQLDHPGIVPVHELGLSENGELYFTMRLVKGRTLKDVFELVQRREDGWNVARALHLFSKVCEAVSYAHDKGVIHRDLKPANIMVGRFGEVYVMDWGLARVLGARRSPAEAQRAAEISKVITNRAEQRGGDPDTNIDREEGEVLGTPVYMPPEQALGHIDELGPPSDVYAVGAMLYQLLSQRLPYVEPGERPHPRDVIDRVLSGPPAKLDVIAPGLPRELVAICEKAMARFPDDRYRSMGQLSEELRKFLEDGVGGVDAFGTRSAKRRAVGAGPRRLAVALAIVLSASLAALATWKFKAVHAEVTSGPENVDPSSSSDLEHERRSIALLARIENGDASARAELELELERWSKTLGDTSKRRAELERRLGELKLSRQE